MPGKLSPMDVGRALIGDIFSFGSQSQWLMKSTKEKVKEWTMRRTGNGSLCLGDAFMHTLGFPSRGSPSPVITKKKGSRFRESVLKVLSGFVVNANDLGLFTEVLEITKTLQEKRAKAHYLLDKYVKLTEINEQDTQGKQSGKTYRRCLHELEQSMELVPEITPELVRSAIAAGELEAIEKAIQSVLKLGEECKASATQMLAVTDKNLVAL